jgi:hypothetical protein
VAISVVSRLDSSKGFKELGRFKAKFGAVDKDFTQVGFEATEVHHVNKRGKNEVVTMSELAYWLHEGTEDKRIPSRPFFDITMQNLVGSAGSAKMRPMVRKLFIGLAKEGTARPYIEAFLKELGKFIMLEAMQTFGSDELTANAASTIRAKGSDKPLIDGVTTNADPQLREAMKVKTSREGN